MNLGLLFYFKYSNFFIENVNAFLGLLGFSAIKWTKLVLPIGISFYTFETITYVVDVYRGVHKPLKNFWDYQLYIILFPKLIAGPIIRYHDLADQITDRTIMIILIIA
jgi:alginate O-acetyltransferase complex protein AlgI